ncbi:uncharacterized protein LOC9638309 isoform X2 [Selaginella moellendorffii]|uniref:uncharacterized protein LOC9638309 isoform X2 n=1 Tax=Selaginella moellendorffii TaxID=88036 RepID=UPI000D1C37C3|nr:uncharacterized protein LOC9638309 isoform X2 [Selaginella moellendorffii]|eukprot:XP_024523545.1 uncharacterized protein LOC9638309 isoform X2 [Selaginella moellendorffii]
MILRRGFRGGGCPCWCPSGGGGGVKEGADPGSGGSGGSSSENTVTARVLPSAPASGLARILSRSLSRKEREDKEAAAREEQRIQGIIMAAMVSDSKTPKDVRYDPHAPGDNPFELPHLADFLPLPPVESTYRAKSGYARKQKS